MSKKEFEKIVAEAIKFIPQKFLRKLANVVIIIQDKPDKWQLKKLKEQDGYRLLGLYEGVPQLQRGFYSSVLPDKITLFQKYIEEEGKGDINIIKEIVRNTVWHEIAHHFGFDESEIKKLKTKNRHQH